MTSLLIPIVGTSTHETERSARTGRAQTFILDAEMRIDGIEASNGGLAVKWIVDRYNYR